MKEFADYISDAFVHCTMVYHEGKFDIKAIYANKQLEKITNKTLDQIIGYNMTEVFPELTDSIFDWPKILCEAAMTNEHTVIEQYVNAFEKYVKFNIFGFKDDKFYLTIQDLTHKREIRRLILEKDRQDVYKRQVINMDMGAVSNDFKVLLGDGSELCNKLTKINGKQVLVNRIPIIIDNDTLSVVVNIQETSNIQKIERNLRAELYRKGFVAKHTFSDIIGDSDIIKETVNKAKKIGRTNSTVLITAETGCGKELFAQSMHNLSRRMGGPFVAVNCAALPENLLESELFGYEEGAFTGAKRGGKIGMFELAHKGTIFLDEISEIPLGLQGRLLRVLQEKEIQRVGGDSVVNVDIRIIVASNKDLFDKVVKGSFREDLFFRINVLDLYIPPVRERKQDIPLLLSLIHI